MYGGSANADAASESGEYVTIEPAAGATNGTAYVTVNTVPVAGAAPAVNDTEKPISLPTTVTVGAGDPAPVTFGVTAGADPLPTTFAGILITVALLSPSVISFDTSPLDGCALYPINVLLLPDTNKDPA